MDCGWHNFDFTTGGYTPPNQTSIVEKPSDAAEPSFIPRLPPTLPDDMINAWNLLHTLKTQIIAGVCVGFAKHVHYPIQTVLVGCKPTFNESGGFANNLRALLTAEAFQAVIGMRETDPVVSPDGVRLVNGTMWITLYCMDALCSYKEYLVTQINN